MFADDTTIVVKSKDILNCGNACQDRLEELRVEFAAHGLLLNATKTNLMHMMPGASHMSQIQLGGCQLEPTKSAPFLGLTIDYHLKWNTHIEELIKKLNSSLFVIRRLSLVCPLETATQAYHSLMMSHIGCGITAWGGKAKCRMDSIFILNKH